MPIYEYRCNECQHEVEALRRLSDPPLLTCPACGKDALSKLVSAAGFQLKGSGWYVTDFRGNGSGAKKAAKTDAAPSDAASGAAKTESAPKTESSTPAAAPAASSGSSGSSDS